VNSPKFALELCGNLEWVPNRGYESAQERSKESSIRFLDGVIKSSAKGGSRTFEAY
jgi:hypothetical protein